MNTFINIIITIGVTAIIGGLIYIGRKLQILDTLEATMEKMKGNLNVVCNHLIKKLEFDPSELKTYSPFQLTDKGEEFIKKLGFDNVFKEHKDDFFNLIDSEKPKLKYDVETLAIKSVAVLYEKEYMNFLKVFFYNNPKRTFDNTSATLGVYVRDKYLEAHPEITQ